MPRVEMNSSTGASAGTLITALASGRDRGRPAQSRHVPVLGPECDLALTVGRRDFGPEPIEFRGAAVRIEIDQDAFEIRLLQAQSFVPAPRSAPD